MECPQCGQQIGDDTVDCPRCARLAQDASASPPPRQVQPPSTISPLAPTPIFPSGTSGPWGGDGGAGERRINTLAIVALVIALTGFCSLGIGGLAGLVLSIIAQQQIRKNPRLWKGLRLANAAMVISGYSLALGLSHLFNYVRYLSTPRGKLVIAASYRTQINVRLQLFHRDTGLYPDTLVDVVAPDARAVTTKIPPGSYHGPYLPVNNFPGLMVVIGKTHLPANPLINKLDTVIAHHWIYDKQTGTVESAVSAKQVDAIPTPSKYLYQPMLKRHADR